MKRILYFIVFISQISFGQTILTNNNHVTVTNKTMDYNHNTFLNFPTVTAVDTIWRVAGTDSIYFKINGTQYAILDSIANISGKLNISDTAAMLAHYYNQTGLNLTHSGQTVLMDTSATSNYYVRRKDSVATGYYPYSTNPKNYLTSVTEVDTIYRTPGIDSIQFTIGGRLHEILDSINKGTVTSIATGVGLTGGTITSSGTIKSDTTFHASSSQTGYLSNIDWNTFNNKGSGSVTLIATGVGLTGGTITTTGTIKSDTTFHASGSQTGYLDNIDWTTFNNKQATVSATAPLNISSNTIKIVDSAIVDVSAANSGFGVTNTNKNTVYSTLAQSTDTSSWSIQFSAGYKPFEVMNNSAGTTTWKIDTTGTVTTGVWKGTSIDTAYTNAVSLIKAGQGITVTTGGKADSIDIATGAVTNAMLAGSIAASKLVGTDIATVGTITSGTWHGTSIDTAYTNAVSQIKTSAPITLTTGGKTDSLSMHVADASDNGYLSSGDWTTFNGKQAALVSGTNIKTINSSSVLGSGNLVVTGTPPVVGTINNYTAVANGSQISGDTLYEQTVTTSQPGLAPTGDNTAYDFLSGKNTYIQPIDYSLRDYNLLGGVCLAQPPNKTILDITTSSNTTSGNMYYIPVYLPQAATITGIKWYQVTIGNFTVGAANAYNGAGIYSYSAGTLTMIDTTIRDSTIWKTSASASWGSKAFRTTHALSAGIYYVGILYQQTAQTTAPAFGAIVALGSTSALKMDFTNSAVYAGFKSSTTVPPSSIAMSSLSVNTNNYYIAIY